MFTQDSINALACPFDGASMILHEKSMACQNRHTFDISKEGYVNLLVSRKRFKETVGDTREMLDARERFLQKGFYNPLLKKINEIIISHFTSKLPYISHILEPGTGIGFYLEQTAREIEKKFPNKIFHYFGTDISKEAIKHAARKRRNLSLAVADSYANLPFQDNSIAVILNIFSPRNLEEFQRVLEKKGLLIIVIPTETHLHELIETFGLLNIEKEKNENIREIYDKQFHFINNYNTSYNMPLDRESIKEIIQMGPNYSRFDKNMEKKVNEIKTFSATASFELLVYQNNK